MFLLVLAHPGSPEQRAVDDNSCVYLCQSRAAYYTYKLISLPVSQRVTNETGVKREGHLIALVQL